MLVSTNKGDFELNSKQEVISFVRGLISEAEEIWISGSDKYPCLAICVKGEYAAVNYFENEDGDMWLSYDENNDKEVTFLAGGEEWMPDANAVITMEDAINCIDEFLNDFKKPSCIQWQEL